MGRVASAYHAVDVGLGVPHRGPIHCGVAKAVSFKKRSELIPLTEPEVRRLLIRIVWPRLNQDERILMWSTWRRRHQAIARQCHYKTRKRNAQL